MKIKRGSIWLPHSTSVYMDANGGGVNWQDAGCLGVTTARSGEHAQTERVDFQVSGNATRYKRAPLLE